MEQSAMVMLVIIRDFVLAVLLSWVGVDYAPEPPKESSDSTEVSYQLDGNAAETQFLILEARDTDRHTPCPLEWVHS